MSETAPESVVPAESTARREFLQQIGKATVTAPAVALLLAASAKPAAAQYTSARPRRRRR
jgi:hypothetical protein